MNLGVHVSVCNQVHLCARVLYLEAYMCASVRVHVCMCVCVCVCVYVCARTRGKGTARGVKFA